VTRADHYSSVAIISSYVVALVLTVVPVPGWAEIWRPAWVALVLIYWCVTIPQHAGVLTGWLLGLLLDVLTGTLLGQHALALCVTAFLALKLHQRIRVLPVWQQGISVFALILCYQLLLLWINGALGRPVAAVWAYWSSPLTSALLWPWIYTLLRDLRRRHRVS
jgi:rod shape-determining protein MreD